MLKPKRTRLKADLHEANSAYINAWNWQMKAFAAYAPGCCQEQRGPNARDVVVQSANGVTPCPFSKAFHGAQAQARRTPGKRPHTHLMQRAASLGGPTLDRRLVHAYWTALRLVLRTRAATRAPFSGLR
jgi:hypothetical protein